jgi:hypothetical protein
MDTNSYTKRRVYHFEDARPRSTSSFEKFIRDSASLGDIRVLAFIVQISGYIQDEKNVRNFVSLNYH